MKVHSSEIRHFAVWWYVPTWWWSMLPLSSESTLMEAASSSDTFVLKLQFFTSQKTYPFWFLYCTCITFEFLHSVHRGMAEWSRTQTLHTHAPAYKRCLVCFCHAVHMLQHLMWRLLIHPVMSPLHSPKYFLNSLGWMVQSVLKKDKLLVSQLMKMVYCKGFKNFLLPQWSLNCCKTH